MLDEISRLGSGLTENITYSYSSPASVELRSAFRLHPEPSPLDTQSPLTIGIMPKQGNIEILLEFLIKDIPENDHLTLSKGFINYRIPRHPTKPQFIQRLLLERKISNFPSNESPPTQILNAITLLSLYRMQERARDEMRRGDIKSATRHLQLLATHLLKKGEEDLASSVMDEVKFIQHNQSFSEEGEKRLKYGTRALLLPERTEERDL
jgi:Ca-activated chloride channel family protein